MNETDIDRELAELSEKIVIKNSGDGIVITDPAIRQEIWRKLFETSSPKHILALLGQECPDVHMELPSDLNHIRIQHREGQNRTEMTIRTWQTPPRPYTRIFKLTLSNMTAKQQDSGLAGKALSGLLNLLQNCFPNIEDINIRGQRIGAYAWARFGFAPDSMSWNRLKEDLVKRKNSIADALTPEDSAAIDAAINSQDPKSIWKLANKDREIDISDPILKGVLKTAKPTIGKCLLIGLTWDGSLRPKDPEAIAQLKNSLALRKGRDAATQGVGRF